MQRIGVSNILLIFLIRLVFGGYDANNLAGDSLFAEDGNVAEYPVEEDDMLEYLANREMGLNKFGPGDDVDDQFHGDDGRENEKQTTNGKDEKSMITKRAGEAEFSTFVDPRKIRSNPSSNDDNSYGYEKRASYDKHQQVEVTGVGGGENVGDSVFIATATVCTAAAVFGLIAAAFAWRRVHQRKLASQECEYPNYGVTGPCKERSGGSSPVSTMDAKLASSAHLYHYQHTKQQIIAMEQSAHEGKGRDTDDSEGEEDEGDFSVYEYPGLAPTGDIEVTNPLFENVGSPLTKTDPKADSLQPGFHQQQFPGKEE